MIKTITEAKTPSSKSPAVKKAPKAKAGKEATGLEEQFEKSKADQERRQLIETHEKMLVAQQLLHQAKLQTIWDNLTVQLYKMWNDSWLQRQKARDQGFKDWLKVFSS